MEDIYQLLYVSKATASTNRNDIKDILSASEKNNPKNDITGVLFLHGRDFIQVLEGPEDKVKETVSRIGKDPRHEDVVIKFSRSIQKRNFGKWTMRLLGADEDTNRIITWYFKDAEFNTDDLRGEELFEFLSVVSVTTPPYE